MKEPKDLGVKFGSKREATWTNVKMKVEEEIEQAEVGLIIAKETLELCDQKISEEKKE